MGVGRRHGAPPIDRFCASKLALSCVRCIACTWRPRLANWMCFFLVCGRGKYHGVEVHDVGGIVGSTCMLLEQSQGMLLEHGTRESSIMVSFKLVYISPYYYWHVRFMTAMHHEPCG